MLLVSVAIPGFAGATDFSAWTPEPADVFVVDVPNNIGYLIHADGGFISFPVATGQKETVHYIGRTYKANTPIRIWTVQQKQIKGDRRTFGVSGRFLRLYRNGEESPYGIHSYFRVHEWMEDDYRFRSMGCIVVTEDILDIIERTYDAAGGSLTVITTTDVQAELGRLTATGDGNA